MTAGEIASSETRALLRSVSETLRAFARALRGLKMYLPNSPMRSKAVDDARDAFALLWKMTPEVSIAITEHALLVDGRTVYEDEEHGASSLTWILYRDGLRRLDFSAGFEAEELTRFLDIVLRSKGTAQDEDDLVTLLWLANFSYLQFRNVELIADFDALYASTDDEVRAPRESGGPTDNTQPVGAELLEADPVGDAPAAALVNPDEFEGTLRFLDAADLSYLRAELRREYESNGQRQVMAALFDIIETQPAIEDVLEASDILDQCLVEALASGDYAIAALIMREARETLGRATHLPPSVRTALEAMPLRMSEPEVVEQLLISIETRDRAAIVPLIEDLLTELRPNALPPLLRWYAESPPSSARQGVERSLVRQTTTQSSLLVRLLQHVDDRVVHGAVQLASFAPSPALVGELSKQSAHPDPVRRELAVAALAKIGSMGALQALEPAINDVAREVRLIALKAVSTHAFTQALPRLLRELPKKSLRAADISEKFAFFEALGRVAGENEVALLDKLLNGRGLMGYTESSEMRASAAQALGHVASAAARKALERAADSQDVIVRRAVSRALSGSA